MVAKRPPLINGEIYHIVVRAIDPIELFRDKRDYFRMIYSLFVFNDENPTSSVFRKRNVPRSNLGTEISLAIMKSGEKKKRKVLVEILAFCLMPNHIHLLVRQVRNGGISKFMQKLGTGYAMYYNKKYERQGHLFQGRYRIVHVKTQEQLKTLFVYIHTNPVSLIVPHWREKGIEDLKKVIKFLEDYKWSSYPDYLGKKNFSFLTRREFLTKVMSGIDGCQESVNDWLEFKKELADLEKMAIEYVPRSDLGTEGLSTGGQVARSFESL